MYLLAPVVNIRGVELVDAARVGEYSVPCFPLPDRSVHVVPDPPYEAVLDASTASIRPDWTIADALVVGILWFPSGNATSNARINERTTITRATFWSAAATDPSPVRTAQKELVVIRPSLDCSEHLDN